MFYSQVILSKKGPLGKVWQAAHWGDKKLSRPAIFATNIEETVDHIVDPSAPLALRVSSHLLWGVVRIYSRKVQFLLDDCQQAVTKVSSVHMQTNKNSRSPNQGQSKIDLPARGSNKNQLNVSHFGEFSANDDFGVAVDFEIPFDIDKETTEEDWVPAELPDEAPLQIPEPEPQETANPENEEDNWGNVEFNPFEDDEEEEKDNRNSKGTDNSTVSDIENPRQAPNEESVASLNTGNNDTSHEVSRTTGAGQDDEAVPMVFDDDDMIFQDDNNSAQAVDISDGKSLEDGAGIEFGGSPVPVRGVSPSASEKSNEKDNSKKRRGADKAPKKKKKRKILIDDDDLVLTNDHIKEMLEDTSSIAPPSTHPIHDGVPKNASNDLMERLSADELLLRPTIGDDSFLAKELVALWARNTARVAGKPFPYDLIDDVNSVDDGTTEKSKEDDDSVENRRGEDEVAQDGNNEPVLSDEEQPIMNEDEEMMIPFDDDHPPMDMAVDIPMEGRQSPIHSDGSVFSLGATNDLQDMQDDEPLTSAKWHKNTVKVFEVLKHNLQDADQVSFQKLSKNTSRRTAVGFFFEMLQLKTLDYIDIQQDESYGDIQISHGVKFDEDAPVLE